MRRQIFAASALLAALAFASAAAAQEESGYGSGAIRHNEDCYVMKQHVLAVSDSRVAVVDNPGANTGIYMNNSGSTARSDDAVRAVMAGDRACADNDRLQARADYQQAIDDLTAP